MRQFSPHMAPIQSIELACANMQNETKIKLTKTT